MFTRHRPAAAGVLAAALLVTAPACASQGAFYRYPGGARTVDERAYAIGYDQGRSLGQRDAGRRRSFDYGRHDAYRDANDGYRGYGDRYAYRTLFRQGFVAGYNDGYRRYARGGYGGGYGGGYASPGARRGLRDGCEQGRDDARDGARYDPVRARNYRSGNAGYSGRYGSRDDYKREYRAAFQAGYDQGYRENRR